jgi:hypothetical protein
VYNKCHLKKLHNIKHFELGVDGTHQFFITIISGRNILKCMETVLCALYDKMEKGKKLYKLKKYKYTPYIILHIHFVLTGSAVWQYPFIDPSC